MWARPDDLIKIYSELPPPPLLLSSDNDLNVDDLEHISFEDDLNQKIEAAVVKWREVS